MPFDYLTGGFAIKIPEDKIIHVSATINKTELQNGNMLYGILQSLDEGIHQCTTSSKWWTIFEGYKSLVMEKANLSFENVVRVVQDDVLKCKLDRIELFIEAGTAWWIAAEVVFPAKIQVHTQMRYGQLGWALEAATGAAAYLEEQDPHQSPVNCHTR